MTPFERICATRTACAACRDPKRSAKLHAAIEVRCPLNLPMGATVEEITAAINAERTPVRAERKPVELPEPLPPDEWPWAAARLAMLATADDRGLGDTIHSQLKVGGRDLIGRMLKLLNIDCGCSGRQKWLNARYPYPPAPEGNTDRPDEKD